VHGDSIGQVAVCGSGPVGAAFALLLLEFTEQRCRPTLIDARPGEAASQDERLLAISSGSRILLERIGVWSDDLATPIERIHVSRRGAFGRCEIACADYGLAALGYVIEYGRLVESFEAVLRQRGLAVMRPERVASAAAGADAASITLGSGRTLDCAYVVHAEGGVFAAQQPKAVHRDYGQTAITAFITCEFPEAHVAWERFTDGGPLALLPARRNGRPGLCLVWCCPPDAATRLSELDDSEFLAALHDCFGDRLGHFTSVTVRQSYPLGLNAVREVAAGREFAIGNAAQTLHPVGGQGLNLGLRDAYSLARLLSELFGAPEAVRRGFLRARRRDRFATVNLTDSLARVFRPSLAPLSALRSAALTFLDLVPPVRQILARQMIDGQR